MTHHTRPRGTVAEAGAQNLAKERDDHDLAVAAAQKELAEASIILQDAARVKKAAMAKLSRLLNNPR